MLFPLENVFPPSLFMPKVAASKELLILVVPFDQPIRPPHLSVPEPLIAPTKPQLLIFSVPLFKTPTKPPCVPSPFTVEVISTVLMHFSMVTSPSACPTKLPAYLPDAVM